MQKATPNIGIPHEIREKRPSAVHPPNLAILLPHAPKELNTDEAKHGNKQQQQEFQSKRKPTHQTNIGETGIEDRNQKPESKSAADIEDADPEGRAHGGAQKILPQRKEEDHN